MSTRKHGLGMLGLLVVAALGVMAFASSALAATPQFTVNGAPSTAALDTQFTTVQLEGAKGTLSIPGLNTEINCELVELKGGLIASPTDAKIEKLLYQGCTVLEMKAPLAEIASCVVSDVHAGSPSLKHITVLNPLLLPIEFIGGEYGVLVEKISVFINFLSGKGCPLPLKTEVKGEVCLNIAPGTNDTGFPLVVTSETIQKTCPKRFVLEGLESNPVAGTVEDKLLYGAQTAFIAGSALVQLTAFHGAMSLGVLLF